MSFPLDVENHNYAFLTKYKLGEKVGLLNKKLVYVSKNEKVEEIGIDIIKGIAVGVVSRKLMGVTDKAAIMKVLNEFEKNKLLGPQEKEAIYRFTYDRKIDDLAKVQDPFVAEATIVYEMSQDPNISEAYRKKIQPEFVKSGRGGVYFLKDRQGQNLGVFKPSFQELGMPGNPKETEVAVQGKRNVREGHEDGTGWLCEVAASEIDDDQFFGVPRTVKLTLNFPTSWNIEKGEYTTPGKSLKQQEGSFQVFVHGAKEVASDSDFQNVDPKEIQKVFAFDLLTGSNDRNFGNVLVKGSTLVPIDHSLILFDNLDWTKQKKEFISQGSSQLYILKSVEEPLDEDLKKKILSYNLDEKCKKLKELGISDASLREHRIRVLFLQEGIRNGLTLKELGKRSLIPEGALSWTTTLDRWVGQVQKLPGDFEANFKKHLVQEFQKLKGKV